MSVCMCVCMTMWVNSVWKLFKVGTSGYGNLQTMNTDKWATSKSTQLSTLIWVKLLLLLEYALKLNFEALQLASWKSEPTFCWKLCRLCIKLPIYLYSWFGNCHTGDSYLQNKQHVAIWKFCHHTLKPENTLQYSVQIFLSSYKLCMQFLHLQIVMWQ